MCFICFLCERVVDSEHLSARVAEDCVDVLVDEGADYEIGAGHVFLAVLLGFLHFLKIPSC